MRPGSVKALAVLIAVFVLDAVAAAIVWSAMPEGASCRRSLGSTAATVVGIGVVVFGVTSLGVWWQQRRSTSRVRPWWPGVLGGVFAADLFGALFVIFAWTGPNTCGG